MYEVRYGLRKAPFSTSPDPSCLYLTPGHVDALAGLVYCVLRRKGFGVLTGDAGTGKSTLIRKLIDTIPSDQMVTSVVLNPTLKVDEFLEMALLDFGITDIPAGKLQRLLRLQQFLLEAHAANRAAVLIIDEAQKLSPEVLEEIRLLTNLENADSKLLQIVLTGQPDLADMLNRDDLRQLKQRIAVRLYITALSPEQVPSYMQFRWKSMGATQSLPFSAEALECVARSSGGIPRLINAVSDNALTLALANETGVVGITEVTAAARSLDLLRGPAASLSFKNGAAEIKNGAVETKNGVAEIKNGAAEPPGRSVATVVSAPAVSGIRLQFLDRYVRPKRMPFSVRLLAKLGLGRTRIKYEQDLRRANQDRVEYRLDPAKDPS